MQAEPRLGGPPGPGRSGGTKAADLASTVQTALAILVPVLWLPQGPDRLSHVLPLKDIGPPWIARLLKSKSVPSFNNLQNSRNSRPSRPLRVLPPQPAGHGGVARWASHCTRVCMWPLTLEPQTWMWPTSMSADYHRCAGWGTASM